MKRVPFFKPGKHTAANGVTLDFSEEALSAAIKAYDPAKHEAPLVIGHPRDNGPAYGWVQSLAFADGELVADVDQVHPEFAELVASGAFKKRSASWYTPDSPSNPVPGVFYLRHIGFLGAQPPAVKGLSPVQFNEDEEGVVEFADDAFTASVLARLFRSIREAWLAKFGQEEADRTLPGYLIEDLEAAAREKQATPAPPSFRESAPSEEPTMSNNTPNPAEQLQADLDAARARLAELESQAANFSEREAQLRERERAAAVATIRADLDEHVKAGRILPAHVAPLAEFMASLDDQGEVVEFGEEQDGKAPKVSPRAFMAAFIAQLPKAVDFSERAPGSAPSARDLRSDEIAERARAHVNKVREETGREISYSEAVRHVISAEGGE